jgi:5-aminolevulinate synthase
LKKSVAERRALHDRAASLRRQLDASGIPHLHNESHIVLVMVGEPVLCKLISDRLLDHHGIYVQPINFPTVPPWDRTTSVHAFSAAQRAGYRPRR